jgi:acetolactate synthase-1/2/3 large subunit
LLLPKDIQQAVIGVNGGVRGFEPVDTPLGDPRAIACALRHVDGPITIIAGEQVARDDARDELEQLRSMLRARIATVPDAKDVAGTPGMGSSSALGVTGVMGNPGVVDAIADSALCLLLGTRLSVTSRAGLDEALASVPVFSIGSAAPYLACTHVHTEDLRGSLRLLTAALSGQGRPTRTRVPDEVVQTELQPPAFRGPGIRYRDAMTVLHAVLPDGADVVVDAGNIGASAIHYLPVRRDGRFIVALGMGGMGYSFGAGVGMAFGAMSARATSGRQSSRVIVIAGDGSFFMHGMEIHTAVQYKLPMTFLLFDNHAHAMCVTREQLLYDDLYSYNRFGPSRLGAGLATMFPGLQSVDVDDVCELEAAVRTACETDGPSVVSIECSADEIPPFANFLGNTVSVAARQPHLTKENHSNVTARA